MTWRTFATAILASLIAGAVVALAITATLAASAPTAAAEPYLDVGLAIHQTDWAEPDVEMTNPLATWELGYEHERYSVYLHHISSVTSDETGYGLTAIGARVRLTLDDLR